MDLSLFDTLGENDMLFIDSTHVAKINSDVCVVFFEILPRLKSGVLVHFHDIFYPFSYPDSWLLNRNAWNESYMLRAFLEFNNAFEIVFFNTCLHHLYRARFEESLPLSRKNHGGSIWIRRK